MQRFLNYVLRCSILPGLLLVCLSGPLQAKEHNILVLGDSISAAYGMSLEQGWVALLAGQLEDSHPDYSVVNASISGETTGGALRRLPALLIEHTPALVIIELGGNDGLRGHPIKSFRANLGNLVQQSAAAGARVVLLPMEIPPNYGVRYTSSFRQSYNLVAEDTGSFLAPFILYGIIATPGMMQGDGIHPTADAQAKLLDNVLPTLIEALTE